MIKLFFIIVSLVVSTASFADEAFKIDVTRTGDDVYTIDGTNRTITTRYCYEYVYNQEVILVHDCRNDYNVYECGQLIFLRQKRFCDVTGVY